MKKRNKLKLADRAKIEACLEEGKSINEICRKLGFSKQTIYREIIRNSIYRKPSGLSILCEHDQKNCKYRTGNLCVRTCPHFIQKQCIKVVRFPFVCNTCEKKVGCRMPRRYYYANNAQEKSQKVLKESRKGIKISQNEFETINEIVSPLVKQKQSLNHILTAHTEINVNERTLRNWINNGYMDAKDIDLPRKVSFKPKKEYIHRIVKPTHVLNNRTFKDYKSFCKNNPNLLVSQLDTVVGKISDNVRILTIHFPSLHFQFGILLNENTPAEVNSKLLELRSKLGNDLWKKIFPIMLCDNGIEFNDIYKLENDENGNLLTKTFFCNPYCSSQKGACERNHEFIRYIEPKHHSFNHLNQDKVNLIFSHINSVYRKSLNGVRPIDLAIAILGKDFLDMIGIKKIEPDDVNLTQSLTKKIKTK